MNKPSGYQIINLGAISLETTATDILKGVNADVDLLIELNAKNKLGNKPIILSFYDDSQFDAQVTGIPSCVGNKLQISNIWDDASGVWSIVIVVTNTKITYQFLSIDF